MGVHTPTPKLSWDPLESSLKRSEDFFALPNQAEKNEHSWRG